MNAVEAIIEKIKALPPDELAKVIDYMRKCESEDKAPAIKYIDPEKTRVIADKVFTVHDELLRKLAE